MLKPLQFVTLRCSAKSDQSPPSNLEGSKKSPFATTDVNAASSTDANDKHSVWRTDVPISKCSLTFGFGPEGTSTVQLHSILLRSSSATHVEVWGIDKSVKLVERTEILPMLEHKKSFAASSSPNAAVMEKRLLVPADAPVVERVILHVMCLWDPPHSLGLDNLQFEGTIRPHKASAQEPNRRPILAVPEGPTAPLVETRITTTSAAVSVPKIDFAAPEATCRIPDSRSKIGDPAAVHVLPLSGCVIVFSGFVNPLRSELRDKALALGAKVNADWDPTCTHLVCAAPHTPKFTQVEKSGHGAIVKKEWLLRASEARERPVEASYRLDGCCDDHSTAAPPAKKMRVVL